MIPRELKGDAGGNLISVQKNGEVIKSYTDTIKGRTIIQTIRW